MIPAFRICLPLAAALALLTTGCVEPGYPYSGSNVTIVGPSAPAPLFAPPPVVIAPTFYSGWGHGYWYGNQFWPYRPGCGFYNGRYYYGNRGGYYHGYHHWHGGGYWYR